MTNETAEHTPAPRPATAGTPPDAAEPATDSGAGTGGGETENAGMPGAEASCAEAPREEPTESEVTGVEVTGVEVTEAEVTGADDTGADASGTDAPDTEGVIRFRYTLAEPELIDTPPVASLRWAQGRGRMLGILGRDDARYDGLAFGNLSLRAADGEGFWITASQRIDVDALAAEDVVRIARVTADGDVTARGTRPPSSETLTHGAVHSARPKGALAVVHGHAPLLWQDPPAHWERTPEDAANGTRSLARAVGEAVRAAPERGAVVLGGHRDGIVAWGPDFSEVYQLLDAALDAATGHAEVACDGAAARGDEGS